MSPGIALDSQPYHACDTTVAWERWQRLKQLVIVVLGGRAEVRKIRPISPSALETLDIQAANTFWCRHGHYYCSLPPPILFLSCDFTKRSDCESKTRAERHREPYTTHECQCVFHQQSFNNLKHIWGAMCIAWNLQTFALCSDKTFVSMLLIDTAKLCQGRNPSKTYS